MVKFLTYQCLLIQLVHSLLHVAATFVKPLRGLRDLVFTTLAYPVGSIVVYSFWAVWIGFGRELIFPVAISEFIPDWFNHAIHTVIAPANLLTLLLVPHKFYRRGLLLTLLYVAAYTAQLHYIKFKSGFFVYKYLEELNDVERLVYFAGTGVLTVILYKSGQLLASCAHAESLKPSDTKKAKRS